METNNLEYKTILVTLLYELERAISYRNALNKINELEPITSWSFFTYSSLAMYDAMFLHIMKIFDRHKDALAFKDLMRINQVEMEEELSNNNLDVIKIEKFTESLKNIRDKTHFHFDKKAIFDSPKIWNESNIVFDDSNEILDKLWLVLQGLYKNIYGKSFIQPIYDGDDIESIFIAVKEKDITI